MPSSRDLSLKAEAERARCCKWLERYIAPGPPKAFTKQELRRQAMAELAISKNSFDEAWILVIEKTGCHDWYEPLRGKRPVQ